MASVDLLSRRLANWPDQSTLKSANNGAEVARVADALGVQVDEVKAAVEKMRGTGLGDASTKTNLLTGASATVAPTAQGNLGWSAGAGDARGPQGIPLPVFLSDVYDFGAASPQAQAALSAYVGSFEVSAGDAEAAAKVMLTVALNQPLDQALKPAALSALHALEAKVRSLEEPVSTASKRVLAAKAEALGKAFFEPGTLKRLRQPEILHRDLRDSPVTSPAIALAQKTSAGLEAQLDEVRQLYARLREAGNWFDS